MEYSKLMMKVVGHEPKPCPRTPLNWSIIVELASLTKEQTSGRRGDGFVSVSGNPHISPSPCTNYAPPSVRHRTDDRNRDEHFLCRMAAINTAHEGYMAQRTRGSESMTTAAVQWTAPKAAHRLTHILDTLAAAGSYARFPVDVKELAARLRAAVSMV